MVASDHSGLSGSGGPYVRESVMSGPAIMLCFTLIAAAIRLIQEWSRKD